MGKGQSKSYDFTGESVKKRSGSKKSNGVEARTSKNIDPDSVNSGKSENVDCTPINRTSLPVTKEEPINDSSAHAQENSNAVSGEQNTTTTKNSEESSETNNIDDSKDSVNANNSSEENSETSKTVNSEETTLKVEDQKEEKSESETLEQGPLEEEDLDKDVQNQAEEPQKEAEDLKENQKEAEESEVKNTEEEETGEGPEDTNKEPPSEEPSSVDNKEEEPADNTEEVPPDTTEEVPPDTTEEEPADTTEEEATIADDSQPDNTEQTEDQEEPDQGEPVQVVTDGVGVEQQEDSVEDMADTVSAVVCRESDLKDGEMKEFDLGDGKVLVVREGPEFHALGSKCTHYGAPLINGSHCNGRVRCPWHGACFSVKTGDIEDFPGLDSIPKFKTEVKDGNVKVTASKSALADPKVQRNMCKAAKPSDKKVLIIGGGPSSVTCAETLRQEGFTGEITIATQENNIPYDRPKLSKALDMTADKIALRSLDFYTKADINILKQKQATAVDTSSKTVTFKDGSTESYTSLVVATGGRPRVLPIPGTDLENVYQLRTPEDANQIAEKAAGKNVVIIGSSFIGMEVAASVVDKARSVSVLARGKVPFQNTLGLKIGTLLKKMHEDNGMKFYFERGIKEFVGSDGKVTEAVLSDDTKLPADVCIMGVGVVPATDFIKDSGIDMTNRGFIPVNKMMQTNQSDVYATGDIVEFPLFSVGDQKVNVQHWQMAHAHGKTAALGILGKDEPIRSVPFFWTVQYKKSIRYTGYGPGYDDIIVHGDLDAPKFIAYYTKGDEVVAAASLNFDPFVSRIADMMLAGEKILKSEVQSSADGWMSRFEKLSIKA
ncbi:apoptosis-inducing factor 3-like isoform X2 [Saccostrea cucullata]|uniref:apoptosis-inducing factor 3-like isoform X2 n=1 Tax=Saccostrea cuccullata TaxID=36930 RepID=UPI002ED57EB8